MSKTQKRATKVAQRFIRYQGYNPYDTHTALGKVFHTAYAFVISKRKPPVKVDK